MSHVLADMENKYGAVCFARLMFFNLTTHGIIYAINSLQKKNRVPVLN